MFQLRDDRFKEDRFGNVCMAMVMLLCLCVMVQMLGVPVTLLNPEAEADTVAVSASEGFSVPSSVPQLTPSVKVDPVTDGPPSVHAPALAAVLFHPPPVR